MSVGVTQVAASLFHDVSDDDYYVDEVEFLNGKEVIYGYPDGTFRPDDQITREQAALMVVRALDLDTEERENVEFSDVSTLLDGYEAIAVVMEEGLFTDFVSGSEFRPDQPLTRGEMAAILVNAYDFASFSTSTDFLDLDSHWAQDDVVALVDNEITAGYNDGTFRPDNPVTRAEFSVFMARAEDPQFREDLPDVSYQWAGEWHRHFQVDGRSGVLTISNETDDQFSFEINVASGGHAGNLDGEVIVDGREASFYDGESGCELDFTLYDSKVEITSPDRFKCSVFGGMQAPPFDGEYHEEELEVDTGQGYLYERGIFDTEEQDRGFYELVGEGYEDFANRFQYPYSEENLDGWDATVVSDFVPGIVAMRAIIMFDDDGHYWAVVDGEGGIKYYSNDEHYQDQLPKTIDDWNTSDSVEYMND
nr:S-layer homology domain-containing protein [Texcoconibacillus texcoconensis]